MFPEYYYEINKIYTEFHHLNMELYRIWLDDMVFRWRWWLGLGLEIMPWLVWIKYHRKESRHRLLYAGLIAGFIATYLDIVGVALGLWSYPSKLIPLIPPHFPWNTSIIPVLIMLFIQFKPELNPIIKGVIFSAIGSFIAQPFSVWIGIYDRKVWKDYYSFPILIALFLFAYYLSQRKSFREVNN